MITVIAVILGFSIGFGLGRIKNKAKLAAIKEELVAGEHWASAEVKSLVARIRNLL